MESQLKQISALLCEQGPGWDWGGTGAGRGVEGREEGGRARLYVCDLGCLPLPSGFSFPICTWWGQEVNQLFPLRPFKMMPLAGRPGSLRPETSNLRRGGYKKRTSREPEVWQPFGERRVRMEKELE